MLKICDLNRNRDRLTKCKRRDGSPIGSDGRMTKALISILVVTGKLEKMLVGKDVLTYLDQGRD